MPWVSEKVVWSSTARNVQLDERARARLAEHGDVDSYDNNRQETTLGNGVVYVIWPDGAFWSVYRPSDGLLLLSDYRSEVAVKNAIKAEASHVWLEPSLVKNRGRNQAVAASF